MKPATSLSFIDSHFFIGIDAHLKNWRVTIRLNDMELKTFSMNPSPLDLMRHLESHYPGGTYHIVYEAGFCGFWALRVFRDHHIDCIIANPADVPTTHKEHVDKSDPVDSRKLARELEHKSLRGVYVPEVQREELRMLMRLRYRIVQSQTRTKNRIKGLLHSQGITIPLHFTGNARWSHQFLLWLEQRQLHSSAGNYTLQNLISQLRELRQHHTNILRQLRKEAAEHRRVLNAIQSAPGVGFITAMALFTEIMDMKRFNSDDALANFVGLVPSTRSSDSTIYANSVSVRHNKFLRAIMIEAAWTAVREDPAMTWKFKELTKRMKSQDAIVRMAKKLLRRIRHLWLHQENYTYALVA